MDPRIAPLAGILRLNSRLFDNCLDSLLRFSDPEGRILLIDDGSTRVGRPRGRESTG